MSRIKGGNHVGIVRKWLQWNAINGDSVTWGSADVLKFSRTLTPALFEKLAQDIRDASVEEIRGNIEGLEVFVDRIRSAVENKSEDTDISWDIMMLESELKNILEELNGF